MKPLKPYTVMPSQYECDPDLLPELNLAAAILRRAVADAKLVKLGRKPTKYEAWYGEVELRQFFKSRWCGALLSVSGLSGEDILEELGL